MNLLRYEVLLIFKSKLFSLLLVLLVYLVPHLKSLQVVVQDILTTIVIDLLSVLVQDD